MTHRLTHSTSVVMSGMMHCSRHLEKKHNFHHSVANANRSWLMTPSLWLHLQGYGWQHLGISFGPPHPSVKAKRPEAVTHKTKTRRTRAASDAVHRFAETPGVSNSGCGESWRLVSPARRWGSPWFPEEHHRRKKGQRDLLVSCHLSSPASSATT